MLGKLMKYEIKSVYKYFLVLYAIMVVGAVMSITTLNTNVSFFAKIGVIGFAVFIVAFIAIEVVQLIFTITRFNTSLLGDEGYLMFTIPSSTHTVIWSKALVLMIFNIISAIVVTGLIASIGFISYYVYGARLGADSQKVLNEVLKNPKVYIGILISIISFIISILESIFLIYASLSFGQLPQLKKNKNVFAFIFFIIFNVIISYIHSLLGKNTSIKLFEKVEQLNTGISNNISDNINIIVGNLNHIQEYIIIYGIIEIIILYLITYYILNKKLNLD